MHVGTCNAQAAVVLGCTRGGTDSAEEKWEVLVCVGDESTGSTRTHHFVVVGASAVLPDVDDQGEHGKRAEKNELVCGRGSMFCVVLNSLALVTYIISVELIFGMRGWQMATEVRS